MKRKLLTVLLMSAMVLAGSTIAKAEDVLETNTEDVISNTENLNAEDVEDNAIALYSENIAINEENFPDEMFRQYLEDNFDKDGDGYFSQDEIDSITSIDVSGNESIKSLVGINYFTSLTRLICDMTGVTVLNISGHPNLSWLHCSSNSLLKELNVSGNPNLADFYCHGNQLSELDVSGNPQLRYLDCDNNSLLALNVSNNPRLEVLQFINNQLSQIDVSKNLNLRVLVCDGNQITSLDISKNSNLQSLHCENNQLSQIDVSKNLNLSSLFCNDNLLPELNLSKNTNLEYFYCNNNQLSELDVSGNPKLRYLDCSNNQLTMLDVSKNTNLADLKCYGNHLANLDLFYNKNMSIRRGGGTNYQPIPDLYGAYVTPQSITANVITTNGEWALNMAAIVGKDNLSRITLATSRAELLQDGTVRFSGSDIPTELVYNYDTKNPAEETPMTVNAALVPQNVDDQTGKDVMVDTNGLDTENICKENNLNISADFKIILSQGTPSKENLDKLTQATESKGYSIATTYEILMSLFSNGQKIADITDNFGRLKLTFQVNASLAGKSAIVYQLHNNSQIIVHDGLTVNTDGTVTITVDKFSSFAVAVKQSSDNTGRPNTNQSGTNKPDADQPGTNQPNTDTPGTNQPDTDQPNINQPNAGQSNTNQTNPNQISPVTGDSAQPAFWMAVAIAAFISGICILNKKRYHKN